MYILRPANKPTSESAATALSIYAATSVRREKRGTSTTSVYAPVRINTNAIIRVDWPPRAKVELKALDVAP
jgi:hypothetical protein